jgi:hypothetical protein
MFPMIRIIGLVVSALLFVSSAAAQQATPTPLLPPATPEEFLIQTDPVSLVGAYYNAISRGDYTRAYSYWETPPNGQTEAQFAAGFADTLNARAIVRLPIFSDAGAGNIFASIPTLVVANRRDGSSAFFAGCLTVHKTNVPVGDAPEPDPNWYLREGDLRQTQTPDLAALDIACDQQYSLTTDPNLVPNQLDPIQLLTSYFNLVANGDGQTAATLWENPPGDLFAVAYGNEVASATSIDPYINPVVLTEGAAGSIYASIPALVISHRADNTNLYITGCYIARLSNVPVGDAQAPDPNWRFYNAAFNIAPDAPAAIAALSERCTPAR